MSGDEPTLTFPVAEESVRAARRSVRGVMRDWRIDDEVSDTAELLVSELVTNAVLHATGSPFLRVRCQRSAQAVTVTVIDHGEGVPVVRHGGLDATSGRGLFLVETLADDWGVRELPHGKAIHFTLSVPWPQGGDASAGDPRAMKEFRDGQQAPTADGYDTGAPGAAAPGGAGRVRPGLRPARRAARGAHHRSAHVARRGRGWRAGVRPLGAPSPLMNRPAPRGAGSLPTKG
ncbi:ATP-binding protein [Streptomyces sp. MMG1522]|uniref:ATP-binding protein n=1 Tax=Streptomyces sp. MMG1522 TaxID=1415545 RepID=UPI0006ADD8EA|nr:ATP-binding protein [Streptomyces sp. MMG1522]